MRNRFQWLVSCIVLCTVLLGVRSAHGQLAAPAIVGGSIATANEFPWQVWLHPTNYNGVYCGASLISTNWALTAAHCVQGYSATGLVVELGMHTIGGTNPYRQTKTISQIIVHPQYNASTMDYDYALLRLSSAATLNTAVAPIAIATSSDTALYANGVNAIVSGWGTTSSGGAVSSVLRKATVPVVDNVTCNANYGGGITARMMCAGYPQGGVDSCQGDSGGPLFVNTANAPKLIGVVSWGDGCALAGKPGVYSHVANAYSWITTYVTLTPQPTATSVPATATSVPVTATSVPATATSAPVTATSAPVTATSAPVTSTPLVSLTPTATRPVTNTRTPSPSRTATRTQTPSRTRTASRTATPRPDWMTRVGNGDFELGNLIWLESSSNYPAVIVNDGRIKARSGKYYAWLGGNNNEASLIQQSLTVPSDAPYLRIYYMLASAEKCGMRYDTAQITINGTTVLNGDIELCNRNTVRAWKAFTVDLRGFATQTVTFDVRVSTDESIVSSLWLDDIGFVRLPTDAINYYGKRVNTSNYAPGNVIQR
ncbi:MAG: trypsin-like serine protease [Roseiflexaceae bacterium]|jgi:secreted trypsin-like serine protease